MRGAVVLSLLFVVAVAIDVGENFFDPDNFTHLDCIPDEYKRVYAYYGDRRKATGQRREPFCAKWTFARSSTVRHILKTRRSMDFFGFLIDEFLFHDECRNLQLDLIAGRGAKGQSIKHFFRDHPGWQQGPWCYVWNGKLEMYEPHPCFETCAGNWTTTVSATTTAPPTTNPMNSAIRYNEYLLEHLHFAEYIWGDLSYYDSKPSDDPLSDSFRRNRRMVFYLLCGIISVLLAFFMMKDVLGRIRGKRSGPNASESMQKLNISKD